MNNTARSAALFPATYLIGAFSHADILWFTSTSVWENLTWAVVAIWLAAAVHIFSERQ